MRATLTVSALLGAVGVVAVPVGVAAQAPEIDAVMARTAAYVDRFVDAFSNVVATEHYVQQVTAEVPLPVTVPEMRAAGMTARTRRDVQSEFLLLRVGGPLEWRPFRDVFEVDGHAIRDRDDRLARLFLAPSPTAIEQAARIAQESARYNIGLAGRTINTPVLSLLFLQAHIQPRFQFALDRRDADVGPNVWRVTYKETARPTLIRGITTASDRDLPASGRFWIDAGTGRVAKAELRMATSTMMAAIVTSFRDDARFGIAVPVEMREEYQIAEDQSRRRSLRTASSVARTVSGVARYDEFRRFGVRTDSTLEMPTASEEAPH